MNGTPTLLLVHGSWHGPWCWEKLTPELDARGLRWASAALPSVGEDPRALGGVADDARAIAAAAAAIAGEVVIVAHSYSGVPVSQARFGANVKRLVFLGAFVPDVGESLADLLPPGPLPPFVVDNGDGTTSVAPELAVATFYADCDPATAQWAVSKLRLHNGACNVTPVTHASWREIASTYLLLTEDFACPTVSQRQIVKRFTSAAEIEGSHSPFLARPKALAAILADIAGSAAGDGLRRRA
ncbi:MAG TPA: alpha/beta hydrolase [Hypericibacter adhaerens]|uniref:alpha/beta hydrolase n=1 Tax=Hypericibacter adhaerens TaxID=2602016 RepID=UPI002CA96F9F|nr:alpha/beta hydrolase [Hypericibacter adhaerens]HWA43988.1 alpha/beta hydrolase [Hypericibacter adhaerens]